MMLGALVSSWQAVKAKRAEQAAQEQAKNAEFIKDFLVRQVLAVNPYVQEEADPGRRALLPHDARPVIWHGGRGTVCLQIDPAHEGRVGGEGRLDLP